MPEIRQATNQPHAAISPEQRSQVAECIHFACQSPDGPFQSYSKRGLLNLADRIDRPGPPLVSTADVEAIIELVSLIDGDRLDHPWGQVTMLSGRYVTVDSQGGRYQSAKPWEVAHMMYLDHLFDRNLIRFK